MDHLIRILASFTNYEQSRDFHKGGVRLDLGNMERLSAAAGDPHRRIPSIHVTGSKGKGSTALMIEALLRASRFRTGLFTSPHLQCLNERIAVNGAPLADPDFVAAADRVLDLLREDPALHPTFFEFITLTAMEVFEEHAVDAAVYEVGLGGRLDATNVLRPEVAVITRIEREHCAVLGETEADIAGEKAGIIKPGGILVTAVPEGTAARRVIEERVARAGAELWAPGRGLRLRVEGDAIRVEVDGREYGPFVPPRPRALQGWNAACALAAVHLFTHSRGIPWKVDDAPRALEEIVLPGRFEVFEGRPPVVLDGAHTPVSMRATLEEAQKLAPDGPVTVLGLARDKDAAGLLEMVFSMSKTVIFTPYPGGRASPARSLEAMAGGRGEAAASPEEALERARQEAGAKGLVLVTGSFYLAGALRKQFIR